MKSSACTELSNRRILVLLGLLGCLLLAPVRILAQVTQQLTGRVTDAKGAVIPEALVSIKNKGTGVVLTTKSNGSGDWIAPYLTAGTYDVTVQKKGFSDFTLTDIILDEGQVRAVDATLKVGAATEVVTVHANSLAVDTETGDRSPIIDGALIADLPFNGRNVMVASILEPGMGSKNGFNNQEPYGNITTGITANSSSLSINMDGAPNQSNGFQTMGYLPLADTVQQVMVSATSYNAGSVGYGTGGVIDVKLKSGTDHLHGSAYEYYKTTGLDANSYFNNFHNLPRGRHLSHQFGGELDGPIIIPFLYDGRDKTFFMVAGEDYRKVTPNTITSSVPGVLGQPSWLTPVNGYYQFAGLTQLNGAPITLYDPATLGYNGNPNARKSFLQEGAPNSYSIPASRVNQNVVNLLKFYPAPNYLDPSKPGWQGNYVVNGAVDTIYKNVMVKLDQILGNRDRVSARWGWWEQFNTQSNNGFPSDNPAGYGQWPNGNRAQNGTLDWTHTLNSATVLDLKVNMTSQKGESNGAHRYPYQSLGISDVSGGVGNPAVLQYFPQIQLGNFATMGSTGNSSAVNNILSVTPALMTQRGPHTIQIGLDSRFSQSSSKVPGGGLTLASNSNWTQQYNNNTNDPNSGLSIASLMLDNGYLSGGSIAQNAQYCWLFHYYAAYFQDNYRVRPNLTLNLGVRYDFPSRTVEKHDRAIVGFDAKDVNPISGQVTGWTGGPMLGGVTFAGVNGQPRSPLGRQWYMVQPRFGFAYAVSPKIVIRGGFGEAFNWPAPGGSQSYGFSQTTQITPTAASSSNFTTPVDTFAHPFTAGYVSAPGSSLGMTAGVGGSVSYTNQSMHGGQTWSFSLGVQQQLTSHDILDISYVGKRFVNAPNGDNSDLPSQSWYSQCNVEAGGNANLCNATIQNPFKGITAFKGTNYYTSNTLPAGVATMQYPQFTQVNVAGAQHSAGLHLDSLQASETHRMSGGLTSTTSYEWQRIIDDNGWLDYIYRVPAHIEDSNDFNHRLTEMMSFRLPVGRGMAWGSHMNRAVDAIVGQWRTGVLFVWESGRPWQIQCTGVHSGLGGNTNCYEAPNGIAAIQVPRHTIPGNPATVRGATNCVGYRDPNNGQILLYSWAAAAGCTTANLVNKALYAPATQIVSTGIRLGASQEFDANLAKDFLLEAGFRLTLKIDAFNVTNHPTWTGGYGRPGDATFGSFQKGPTGQSNNPRQVQISAALHF